MYNKAPQSYWGGECGKPNGTDIFYGYRIVDNPISVKFNKLIEAAVSSSSPTFCLAPIPKDIIPQVTDLFATLKKRI